MRRSTEASGECQGELGWVFIPWGGSSKPLALGGLHPMAEFTLFPGSS